MVFIKGILSDFLRSKNCIIRYKADVRLIISARDEVRLRKVVNTDTETN
jgi:hypothetical protein